jgi:hypothetical protein
MNELTAHPYFSSKVTFLTYIREAWHRGSFAQGEGKAASKSLSQESLLNWEASITASRQSGRGEIKWEEAREASELGFWDFNPLKARRERRKNGPEVIA